MNNGYMSRCDVNMMVTRILVDARKDTVMVQLSAALDSLFPSIVTCVIVIETGYLLIGRF